MKTKFLFSKTTSRRIFQEDQKNRTFSKILRYTMSDFDVVEMNFNSKKARLE